MDIMPKEIKINFVKFDGENFLSETENEYELGQVITHENGNEARCYRKEIIENDLMHFFEIGNLFGEFKKEINK